MTGWLRVSTAARALTGNRTAIAAVLRWEGAAECRTVVRRLPRCEPVQGAYRALLFGLWEARRAGARRVVLGTDDGDVAEQVTGDKAPPAEAIGLYLQVRAMRNAFSETRIVTLEPSRAADSAAAQFAAASAGSARRATYNDLPLWAAAAS